MAAGRSPRTAPCAGRQFAPRRLMARGSRLAAASKRRAACGLQPAADSQGLARWHQTRAALQARRASCTGRAWLRAGAGNWELGTGPKRGLRLGAHAARRRVKQDTHEREPGQAGAFFILYSFMIARGRAGAVAARGALSAASCIQARRATRQPPGHRPALGPGHRPCWPFWVTQSAATLALWGSATNTGRGATNTGRSAGRGAAHCMRAPLQTKGGGGDGGQRGARARHRQASVSQAETGGTWAGSRRRRRRRRSATDVARRRPPPTPCWTMPTIPRGACAARSPQHAARSARQPEDGGGTAPGLCSRTRRRLAGRPS